MVGWVSRGMACVRLELTESAVVVAVVMTLIVGYCIPCALMSPVSLLLHLIWVARGCSPESFWLPS